MKELTEELDRAMEEDGEYDEAEAIEKMRQLAARLEREMDSAEQEEEEAKRKMKDLIDRLDREMEQAEDSEGRAEVEETNESRSDDSEDALEGVPEARKDLHDSYVDDMHNQQAAKEAFSPEAREYRRKKQERNEGHPEQNETGDSHEDAGGGMAYALEKEGEAPSHSNPDAEEDDKELAEQESDRKSRVETSNASQSTETPESPKNEENGVNRESTEVTRDETPTPSDGDEDCEKNADESKRIARKPNGTEDSATDSMSEKSANKKKQKSFASEEKQGHQNETKESAEEDSSHKHHHERSQQQRDVSDSGWKSESTESDEASAEQPEDASDLLDETPPDTTYERQSEEIRESMGTMFPETEDEEQVRRTLWKLWSELDNEERELLRPLLHAIIDSPEDLQEFLEKFEDDLRNLSPEDLKDAENYALLMEKKSENEDISDQEIEQLADELDLDQDLAKSWWKNDEMPDSVRRIINLEAESRWAAIMGIVERDSLESGQDSGVHDEVEMESKGAPLDEVDSDEAAYSVVSHDALSAGYPVVKGTAVSSYKQLLILARKKMPWILKRAGSQRLLKYAAAYFEAINLAMRKGGLEYKDIRKLAEKTGVSHESIRSWLRNGTYPMIFDLMQRGLSLDEAQSEIENILGRLKGVTSWAECKARLRAFYLHCDLKTLPAYQKDVENAKAFYRYIRSLKQGGLLSDIARRAGVSPEHAKSLRHHKGLPRLIRVASMIPSTKPKRGYRWLPTWLNTRNGMKNFIQVPVIIRNQNDVKSALEQLKPKSGKDMKRWRRMFGEMDPMIALMYLLGALSSDGGVGRKEGVSTRIGISLSQKYPWSEVFGELYSYCLGILGITSDREKDTIDENQDGTRIVKANWLSKHNPLSIWLLRTCLGLDRTTAKSKQRIKADWILNLPEKARRAFLQGLADGDGYASIRNLNVGIGTKTNQDLVQRLLKSFGIETSIYPNKVQFHKTEHLNRAASIPLFRAADGRQRRLEEILNMIAAMDRTRVTEQERRFILRLASEGHTPGEISSLLWAELGKARRTPTIYRVISNEDGI